MARRSSVALLFAALLACVQGAFAQDARGAFSSSTGQGVGFGSPARYEQGRRHMVQEDWYSAAEQFLEALRLNPSHAESASALAECYYELREFDQALIWVRRARVLARANSSLANLEALILIALGRLDSASSVIADILAREPYNREALFAAAELEVAGGRSGEAVLRYREAVRRYPDDRRALLSLALVLSSLGDAEGAKSFADRALLVHRGDFRVHFFAAYLDAAAGRLDAASRNLEAALSLRPDFGPARSLLASVRYRSGRFDEALRLADTSIAADRNDVASWYLKGMALIRLGRSADARQVFSVALSIDPEDEFARAALEEALLVGTPLESPERVRWAVYHFQRAADYRSRNLADQALFEYRRGLRINPYAPQRREYAELLRVLGFPGRHLEELRFMQDLGLADRAVNDAVEAYDSLLADALHRRMRVDLASQTSRHWKIAVFSVASQSAYNHVDASSVAAAYLKDLFSHDGNIAAMDVELRQSSFSSAFRTARVSGADYFLILSVGESGRDLSLKGELFVGRTGSPAGTYASFRTGPDRLRNGGRLIAEQLSAALPFRATLIQRRAGLGLMNKGKADGIQPGAVFELVRKGALQVRSEGIGLAYDPADVVGSFTVGEVDELISSGTLSRSGFFDRIAAGDELVPVQAKDGAAPTAPIPGAPADPELRALLRNLRR